MVLFELKVVSIIMILLLRGDLDLKKKICGFFFFFWVGGEGES